jgi:tetratricopeptide (TPR) repeat protein
MLRSVHAHTLFALILSLSACGKKQGTNTPGEAGADPAATQANDIKNATVNALVDLANEDLRKGRYQAARERAERALETDGNNADAYSVIGAANWRAGDFERSTKAYTEALEIDPKNFGAALGLARNHQTVGDHQKAIELADSLLAVDAKQVDPMMYKFWSLYALAQFDDAVKVADEMFKYVDKTHPLQPILLAQTTFARAVASSGPFIQIEGERGTSDAQLEPNSGFKHVGAVAGGEFTRALFYEVREETRIHKEFATTLGLKSVGKVTPAGMSSELDIVIIPEIKLGELTIKNTPALVEDLSIYSAIGDVPGLLIGRQVMQRLGAITFDFPSGSSEFTVAAPSEKPAGSAEAPLLLVDMRLLLVPVTKTQLDDSEHYFYTWFGGSFLKSAAAINKKAFLKSDRLPRELNELDDEQNGLKMVYLDKLRVGEFSLPGVGGLILVNTPPSVELGQLVPGTGFEISGYINPTVLKNLKVTYSVPTGKLYLTARPAAG